jgi:hypothetical protein
MNFGENSIPFTSKSLLCRKKVARAASHVRQVSTSFDEYRTMNREKIDMLDVNSYLTSRFGTWKAVTASENFEGRISKVFPPRCI